jgi:hypothetical protein
MIAWPGLLAFKAGLTTPLEEATCTQRFRTDDVLVLWRGEGEGGGAWQAVDGVEGGPKAAAGVGGVGGGGSGGSSGGNGGAVPARAAAAASRGGAGGRQGGQQQAGVAVAAGSRV